ncbi:hypothetical protein ACH41H_46270 [Streptomyces sp. NPDC020800]|uniref:hypothetical protein n=1 Tax=Streptomyces sp. NPDC020800 TaxID=3365092 RepID=UPI0037A02A42
MHALAAHRDIPALWEDDGSYRCQLTGSHAGPHVALVDPLAWDEDPPVVTYWLWWDDSGHTLTQAPSCANCHLPSQHPANSGCTANADRCQISITISDSDRVLLEDLDDAVHEVAADHSCQYTVGHDGPHVCLAQSQDHSDDTSTSWWVCWPTSPNGAYRITVLPECPATAADQHDDGLCLHPSGHPGNHWW